jgi:hypothetical protein
MVLCSKIVPNCTHIIWTGPAAVDGLGADDAPMTLTAVLPTRRALGRPDRRPARRRLLRAELAGALIAATVPSLGLFCWR